MYWNTEADDVLRKGVAAGLTVYELMNVFPGKSYDAVYKRIQRLGLQTTRHAVIDYAALDSYLKLRSA